MTSVFLTLIPPVAPVPLIGSGDSTSSTGRCKAQPRSGNMAHSHSQWHGGGFIWLAQVPTDQKASRVDAVIGRCWPKPPEGPRGEDPPRPHGPFRATATETLS